MRFDDALQAHRVPSRLGDVHLRYDPPALIGETVRKVGPGRHLPDVAFILSIGCAMAAVAALVTSRADAYGLPVAFALAAAALLVVATRTERKARPRRFALNFLDETLRVDAPAGPLRGTIARSVPFDDVRDVYVVERRDGRYALIAEFVAGGGGAQFAIVLVDRVSPDEAEALSRFWGTLRAAFGLTPKGA